VLYFEGISWQSEGIPWLECMHVLMVRCGGILALLLLSFSMAMGVQGGGVCPTVHSSTVFSPLQVDLSAYMFSQNRVNEFWGVDSFQILLKLGVDGLRIYTPSIRHGFLDLQRCDPCGVSLRWFEGAETVVSPHIIRSGTYGK